MTDNLQSNVLTVDSQGNIGAQFTGKVTATGLTIPAQTGPLAGKDTGVDAAQWIRQSDGVVVADMFGGQSSPGQPTDLQISVLAADGGGGQDAILELTGNQGSSSRADVKAGTQARTLLTAGGQSQFLQLLSTQQLQLALGTGSFTGTGVATVVAGTNTGLPRAPIFGIVIPSAAPSGNWYAQSYTYTGGPSVISFTAKNDGGAFPNGTAFNYFWLAIG